MDSKKSANNQKKSNAFRCEKCDFTCSKQSNYNRHISTRKHIKLHNDSIESPDHQKSATYKCNCGKEFSYNTNLTRHKKTCTKTVESIHDHPKNDSNDSNKSVDHGKSANNKYACICGTTYSHKTNLTRHKKQCGKTEVESIPTTIPPAMIQLLLETFIRSTQETTQSNRELKETFLEMAKNQAPHHNTNSHNKNINLVLFLNENYKDAMNLTDFVNNLQISFDDLEKMTEVGYVEAVSEKFISGLKQLDMKQRPIHFTDKARETLYARENNTWEKDENHKKITTSIHNMGRKYGSELQDYQATHPETKTLSTKEGEFAFKAAKQLMSSAANTKKVEKVIQNIVPTAFVERSTLLDSR